MTPRILVAQLNFISCSYYISNQDQQVSLLISQLCQEQLHLTPASMIISVAGREGGESYTGSQSYCQESTLVLPFQWKYMPNFKEGREMQSYHVPRVHGKQPSCLCLEVLVLGHCWHATNMSLVTEEKKMSEIYDLTVISL